jgi:hypothetical protein
MSVGDSFTLVPLSDFFVRKKVSLPGNPDPNFGLIQPIASGFIQTDAINKTGDVVGTFTWYRLSHFEGSPNIQGVELREYLLVCRGVSSGPNASFQLAFPKVGLTRTILPRNYSIRTCVLNTLELVDLRHEALSSDPHSHMFIFLLLFKQIWALMVRVSSFMSRASKHTCAIHVFFILLLPQLEVMRRFVAKC